MLVSKGRKLCWGLPPKPIGSWTPRWADAVWSVFLSMVAVVGLPFASWQHGFYTDTSRFPSCPHYYSSFFSHSKSIYYSAFKWQTVKAAQMEASVLFCDVLLIKIIRLPAEPNRSASPLYLGTSFSSGTGRPSEIGVLKEQSCKIFLGQMCLLCNVYDSAVWCGDRELKDPTVTLAGKVCRK